jgi:hypothetical protein
MRGIGHPAMIGAIQRAGAGEGTFSITSEGVAALLDSLCAAPHFPAIHLQPKP